MSGKFKRAALVLAAALALALAGCLGAARPPAASVSRPEAVQSANCSSPTCGGGYGGCVRYVGGGVPGGTVSPAGDPGLRQLCGPGAGGLLQRPDLYPGGTGLCGGGRPGRRRQRHHHLERQRLSRRVYRPAAPLFGRPVRRHERGGPGGPASFTSCRPPRAWSRSWPIGWRPRAGGRRSSTPTPPPGARLIWTTPTPSLARCTRDGGGGRHRRRPGGRGPGACGSHHHPQRPPSRPTSDWSPFAGWFLRQAR